MTTNEDTVEWFPMLVKLCWEGILRTKRLKKYKKTWWILINQMLRQTEAVIDYVDTDWNDEYTYIYYKGMVSGNGKV